MILCQHGCGKPATYTTKGSLATGPFKGAPVSQCAKSANSCQSVKDRKIASSLVKYGTEYPWQTKEVIETRNQTNLEKYGHNSSIMNPTIQAKRKKTMMDRYGVEEPLLNDQIKKKAANGIQIAHDNDPTIATRIIQTRKEKYGDDYKSIIEKKRETEVAKGRWVATELRDEWQQYKYEVQYHTYRNYRNLKESLNPQNLVLGRTTYQLDHIYSRKAGFENKVDPKIIAHPANLRVISANDNRLKSHKCDITLEELLVKTKGI